MAKPSAGIVVDRNEGQGLAALAMPAPTARTFIGELPLLALVLGLLAALIFAASGDSFTLNILSTTFLFAGLASAWNIIGGFGGQFSLGHSVFFAARRLHGRERLLPARSALSAWLGMLPVAATLGRSAVATLVSWPTIPAERVRSSPSPPWP